MILLPAQLVISSLAFRTVHPLKGWNSAVVSTVTGVCDRRRHSRTFPSCQKETPVKPAVFKLTAFFHISNRGSWYKIQKVQQNAQQKEGRSPPHPEQEPCPPEPHPMASVSNVLPGHLYTASTLAAGLSFPSRESNYFYFVF